MSEALTSFCTWRGINLAKHSRKSEHLSLRFLCLYLRDPDIEDIRSEDVTEFMSESLRLGWDQNSMIPKANSIKKFFEYYTLKGLDVVRPELVPMPQKVFRMPRVCTPEEYARLLEIIPTKTNDPRHNRNAALVRLYADIGARNTEVLDFDTGMVDLAERVITFDTEKSKGRRPFRQGCWSEETNYYLKRWIKQRARIAEIAPLAAPNAIFISIAGAKAGERLTNKGVGELLRRYCERGGIDPPINAHSLRHMKAHTILAKGGNQVDLMNILGHSSLASSTIYTMMQGKELIARERHFLDN